MVVNYLTLFNANVAASLATAWLTVAALGIIPDNAYTHWVSVGAMLLSQFLINMGYKRTPAGNVIPETVKEFVDTTVAGSKTPGNEKI